MRLFGTVNDGIDRYDRAEWLTPPFDLTWSSGAVLFLTPANAADLTMTPATAADLSITGADAADLTITATTEAR